MKSDMEDLKCSKNKCLEESAMFYKIITTLESGKCKCLKEILNSYSQYCCSDFCLQLNKTCGKAECYLYLPSFLLACLYVRESIQ